jgi:hypothetical protein
VVDARYRVADLALHRMLGDAIDMPEIGRALGLLRRGMEACDAAGRALYGGHASLPYPEETHLALWHAATLFREFRGDGHVAALTAAGIGGCESHILLATTGAVEPEMQRAARGWSEEEWSAAEAGLAERGLLDDSGDVTPEGRELHQTIENDTDVLNLPALEPLGDDGVEELMRSMRAILRKMLEGIAIPYPNPMGLTQGILEEA